MLFFFEEFHAAKYFGHSTSYSAVKSAASAAYWLELISRNLRATAKIDNTYIYSEEEKVLLKVQSCKLKMHW